MERVIKIKTHPNSSQEKVEKISNAEFEIWLKEKAIDGKANFQLIKILKRYFGQEVQIKSGLRSRRKIIEVHS